MWWINQNLDHCSLTSTLDDLGTMSDFWVNNFFESNLFLMKLKFCVMYIPKFKSLFIDIHLGWSWHVSDFWENHSFESNLLNKSVHPGSNPSLNHLFIILIKLIWFLTSTHSLNVKGWKSHWSEIFNLYCFFLSSHKYIWLLWYFHCEFYSFWSLKTPLPISFSVFLQNVTFCVPQI